MVTNDIYSGFNEKDMQDRFYKMFGPGSAYDLSKFHNLIFSFKVDPWFSKSYEIPTYAFWKCELDNV